MGYKISSVTTVSFITTLSVTGCVETLKQLVGNSINGKWSMTSLENECQLIGENSFCFNFTEFYFIASEDTLSETVINGDLEILEDGEAFVANFYSTEEALLREGFTQDYSYLIDANIAIDMEGEVLVDFELDCVLAGDSLDCTLTSVLIDGEEDTEDYISDWHLLFERID